MVAGALCPSGFTTTARPCGAPTPHASPSTRSVLKRWVMERLPRRRRAGNLLFAQRILFRRAVHRTYSDHGAFRTTFDRAGFAYQEGMLRSLDSSGRTLSTVVTSRFVLVPCW